MDLESIMLSEKPVIERQVPYDLTYMWNLISKTNKQNITRDMEIKNKLTVTTGKGEGIMGERREKVVKEHV